jgi:predicted nucleic acid-binding protein
MSREKIRTPIQIVSHHDYLEEALSLARRHNPTVYESLFLAVAFRKSGELITADEKLKRAFQSS